jgi:hypothetical protein
MSDAGTWWLKGAWIELGIEAALVDVIETAWHTYQAGGGPPLRVLTHARDVLVRKNETLAFLPLFERMTRPIHLDTYDDDGLGLLTESEQTYRSSTLEHYLGELVRLKIAMPLGQALAHCYWCAWYQEGRIPDSQVFYVDMHDKVVWTNKPSPVGFVSALHEIRACLKQVFVHGRGGHPLYCETHPGDTHLNEVVVMTGQRLEQAVGQPVVQVLVTDREGLAVDVIEALLGQNKALVVLLKANQYTSEADFERHGRFLEYTDPRTGLVTHRVADADFGLALDLKVRAGLIYDLDHPDNLIALITTVRREQESDIRRIVSWYLGRWNAQENSFRDQIAFVHLNLNFGLHAKHAVPDRRVARRITDLTRHLNAVVRKLDSKIAQLADLERLMHNQTARHDKKVAALLRPPKRQGPQAMARAARRDQQLQDYHQRHHTRVLKYLARQAQLELDVEAYRHEQARVTHELTALNSNAQFFEIDPEKDQIVAHLRVALHNSALWARDTYFGSRYRHSTPLTLWRIFFNQDGYYRETPDRILVTLKPFRDSTVQQEAVEACRRFNQRRIKTLSEKTIELSVAESI